MSELAIHLEGVSKLYKVFPNTRDSFLNAVGLDRLMPWRTVEPRMFWSLRDVSIDVPRGSRIGIIGRNGAGKSTLLKLITGALAPTEGRIAVRGEVQALFDAGSGFHPEFSGYENIQASLTYQGMTAGEIAAAVADIEDFTELQQFLNQPIKTYSLGMQARLAFATATAVRPDILIVDEVLGAGDAYFASKSSERMQKLVKDSGATVLIVSHAMDQLLRYCDECVWLERGRIVKRGPTLEVVNAYEGYIHELEDRRLRAKNRQRGAGRAGKAAAVDGGREAREQLVAQFIVEGSPESRCAISEVAVIRDGTEEEVLRVGDVQDSDGNHNGYVVLDSSDWSEPRRADDGRFYRELGPRAGVKTFGVGYVALSIFGSFEEAPFFLKVRYRSTSDAKITCTASVDGRSMLSVTAVPAAPDWAEWSQPLTAPPSADGAPAVPRPPDSSEQQDGPEPARAAIRWPGEGSLTIEDVRLLGGEDKVQAVFAAGTPMTLDFAVRAQRASTFELVVGATLYRLDGVLIANIVSPVLPVALDAGDVRRGRMTVPALQVGDGRYVFSLAIFEKEVSGDSRYDLLSRAFEFQVVGNPGVHAASVCRLAADWSLTQAGMATAGLLQGNS